LLLYFDSCEKKSSFAKIGLNSTNCEDNIGVNCYPKLLE
jgi:hypothetical protein